MDSPVILTAIKKNHKVASLAVKSASWAGDDIAVDNLAINDMIQDIEMLDEESHEQIYLLLRGFKPATFFTTDGGGGGTHFDRTQLSDRQISELYRTVQLCKENMLRKQVLLNAKQEMEQNAHMVNQRMNTIQHDEEDEQ